MQDGGGPPRGVPEAFFTRSDQWIYEQIQSLDPGPFARIRALIAAGRWAVVGGWYIQPDCNMPLAESFRRHMRYGKEHAARHLTAGKSERRLLQKLLPSKKRSTRTYSPPPAAGDNAMFGGATLQGE